MRKKRSDCHWIGQKFTELGSKEDFPLPEAESFYTSLHRQISLNGVRRTVTEARSQLHSLTGAIKWLAVQDQWGISIMYCTSCIFLHASRTMDATPSEQCGHTLSMSRTVFKGPQVTWINVPPKVNYSKSYLSIYSDFFFHHASGMKIPNIHLNVKSTQMPCLGLHVKQKQNAIKHPKDFLNTWHGLNDGKQARRRDTQKSQRKTRCFPWDLHTRTDKTDKLQNHLHNYIRYLSTSLYSHWACMLWWCNVPEVLMLLMRFAFSFKDHITFIFYLILKLRKTYSEYNPLCKFQLALGATC